MIDSTYTVLIVEDDPIDRERYRRSLLADSSCTYQLLEATSVSEGLSLYRSMDIDAVLLDYALPDENGLSFLSAMQAENNGSSPTVVMVTGAGDERVAIEAMKLGAEDYVPKRDLTPMLLQEKIRSAVEKAALQRQLKAVEAHRTEAELDRDRLFDLSLDLMTIATVDGHYLRLNPAWEKAVGFTREELMAEPYLYWVHPDDRSATSEAGKSLSNGGIVIRFENRHLCKDGSYRWLSWNSSPYDGNNVVYAVARDITEQKQIELILRTKEETIQTQLAEIEMIYSTAPIGLCSTDTQFRYIRINKHLAQINGLSVADHIGRTFHEVIPSVADQLEQLCCQVMKSRIPIIDLEMRGTVPHQPDIILNRIENWTFKIYDKVIYF